MYIIVPMDTGKMGTQLGTTDSNCPSQKNSMLRPHGCCTWYSLQRNQHGQRHFTTKQAFQAAKLLSLSQDLLGPGQWLCMLHCKACSHRANSPAAKLSITCADGKGCSSSSSSDLSCSRALNPLVLATNTLPLLSLRSAL